MRERHADPSPAKTLFRGSGSFLAIYLVGSGTSFGVHLLTARELGATSYGHFVYATSWMGILLLGCHIGLRPTVIRFAAAYRARKEWSLLRGLERSSTAWTVAASLVTLALSVGALWLLRPQLDELGWTLLLVACAMPFTALAELWSSILRGLGVVARSQWPASIVQHTLVALLLTAIVAFEGARWGSRSVAAAFLAASLGTLLVARLLLNQETGGLPLSASAAHRRREWTGVAANNLLISLFQAMRVPLIVVIAGAYVDAKHLAYLGAAQRLANILSLGLVGISGFVAPLIAQHHALADTLALRRLARLSALGALGAAAVPGLALLIFGRELLGLFGPGFDEARVALFVLMLGEFAAAAAGPIGFFLTMTARQQIATWIEAATCALVVALALLLIPAHGILGAAIAISTGGVVRNIAMLLAVWHFGPASPDAVGRGRGLR